ncbi:MAG: ABC transporter ATP-binding protein [Deltaproteobacteria bacterium]|nr:ABC transporter ATP-binding protein [Candidatus Zymogenaceae bacterium]
MIETQTVRFRYRDDWVIRDASITIDDGENVAVIGPNGSGKSTLLKILAGLLVPQNGRVLLSGVEISGLSRRKISQKIALVSQDGGGDFPFSVRDVVLMGRAPYLSGFALEKRGDYERAEWAMRVTDLTALQDRLMMELSGGERQRACIARALAQDTDLLLLDEPTAYLDIGHQVAVSGLLRRLHREYRKTVVSVTHDINLASTFFDRVILMSDGAVLADGTPNDVIREEYIRDVYHTEVLVDTNPIYDRPRVTLLDTKREV